MNDEPRALIAQPKPTFSLTPSNLQEAMEFSKIIANSDLVPRDYKGKPGNVLVAVQMGSELGLSPMQSLQGIAMINGRPAVWGDALLALVQAHPDFEWIKETQSETVATCILKRRGMDERVIQFSMVDAQKAGLWNKEGPWKTYPRRMLQMRARGFALRDTFADALKGVITAEEARDIPTPQPNGEVQERVEVKAKSRFEQEQKALYERIEEALKAAVTVGEVKAQATECQKLAEPRRSDARDAYKMSLERVRKNLAHKPETSSTLEQVLSMIEVADATDHNDADACFDAMDGLSQEEQNTAHEKFRQKFDSSMVESAKRMYSEDRDAYGMTIKPVSQY